MRREPLRIHLENFTGYATSDLRRFFERGLRACGVTGHVFVVATTSPIFTRGCASIGGRRLIMAFAAPSRQDMRRNARVLMHEAEHLKGKTHERMPEPMRYSEGGLPAWAKGIRFRHVAKAPDQMAPLRHRRPPRAHRRATRTGRSSQ